MIKRYAIVGTGGRALMYIDPMVTRFKEFCKLVGFCDPNPGRMAWHNNRLAHDFSHAEVPAYTHHDFDRMVKETRPDVVIVCTVDAFHHQYIIRAMELGCDVVTEKPMTIDETKCGKIFDAVRKTGRRVRVAFNYRWAPGPSLVHQLLRDGTIGDVIHVDMEYMLDTSHGADYFRRWHREKDKSGGLMVHKSTHHFDLVNWWIDAVPETVFGFGRLAFYGRENAHRRGIDIHAARYRGTDLSADPFSLDLERNDFEKGLYLDAEKYDGYIRDRNVFGDNITIEDTMSVLVRYRTSATFNYSLNAYLPREGYHVAFNGTKGRLEYQENHGGHVVAGFGDDQQIEEVNWPSECIVHPLFSKPYKVPIPIATGGHGGGDPLIQAQIFGAGFSADPLGRDAGHEQGAASILIGSAANRSFASGQPVKIQDICPQFPHAAALSDLK